MKHLNPLAITTLLACMAATQAVAQTSYPLGHHVHDFQRKAEDGKVRSQGWDPTYSPEDQADKSRMVANIPTFPVGLPGSLEPRDLGNTGCPVNTTIRSAEDVSGLPKISLSGVSGAVYLIYDCDMSGSILRVQDGMKVAVWGSAIRQVVGNSGGSGDVWIVDSLINAGADDNAGVSCLGDTPCRVMYSEVLGGDDIMKMNSGDTCYKSHLHGYDRDSTKGSASGSGEHNDGIQINPGGDFTVINCNIEGPFRTSNAPLFAGVAGRIHNWRVAETLASGGTQSYKLGSKAETDWLNAVLLDSQMLGDAQGVSWGTDSMGYSSPCTLGGGASQFSGAGNRASNGASSGTDQLGRSWDFDGCNRTPVSQANRDFFASMKSKLETWTSQIRQAAGSPAGGGHTTGPSLSLSSLPQPAYTASELALTATVQGCEPSGYFFQCGSDAPTVKTTSNLHVCGQMAPGNYTVKVTAGGGSCEQPLEATTQLTVRRPPAPVLH